MSLSAQSTSIDLSAFLRGDPQTRWATYDIAAKNGILTKDEIRQTEGYGPMREVQQIVPLAD